MTVLKLVEEIASRNPAYAAETGLNDPSNRYKYAVDILATLFLHSELSDDDVRAARALLEHDVNAHYELKNAHY